MCDGGGLDLGAGVLLSGLSCDFENSAALCLWEIPTPAFVLYPSHSFLPSPPSVFYLKLPYFFNIAIYYFLSFILGDPGDGTGISEHVERVTCLLSYSLDFHVLSFLNQKTIHELPRAQG